MVNIKIFEDQTGFQLFPEKSYNKDTTIVKFFDNKIDLYMTKGESGEDFLIISCYVLVHKGPVARSNPGMSCTMAASTPPGATSVTSSARAIVDTPSADTATRTSDSCFITCVLRKFC